MGGVLILVCVAVFIIQTTLYTNDSYPIKRAWILSPYVYTGKANKVQVSFAEKKNREEVKVHLSDQNGAITMKYVPNNNTLNIKHQIQQTGLVFSDVLPDTDISYQLIQNGIKEDIIVKTKEAVQWSYVFEITLEGFVAEYTGSGDFTGRFINSKNRDDYYQVLPLYMEDAEGEISYEVDLVLDETQGKTELRIIPSRDWLFSEDRVYPVIIDPSIVKGEVPLAQWHFDEGYGTTASDASGNANHLTITGATWTRTGSGTQNTPMAVSLQYDGTNDSSSRTYDADFDFGTGSFTISGWFRHPSTQSGIDTLIARYSGAGFKVYMTSDGYICFAIDDDSTWTPDDSACTTVSYADSRWHHFSAVKTGNSSITLYINGNKAAEDSSLTATGSLSGSSPTIYLGIDSDGTSNPWTGWIDNVTIYDYARSIGQVKTDAISPSSQIAVAFGTGSKDRLSDGLVGWWKLDETSSPAVDFSGNGSNGTWSGNTVASSGKFANAADFDGTNDHINISDSDLFSPTTTNKFTVSAWLNPATVSVYQEPISKGAGSNYEWMISVNAFGAVKGTLLQTLGGSDYLGFQTSTGAIAANQWTHVAFTVDLDQPVIKLYLNGQLEGESTSTSGSHANGTAPLRFGERGDGNNDYQGKIDEVRIYNRVLFPDEVRRLYEWAPEPLFYYSFDENTGTSTVYDRSGKGRHGSMNNFPGNPWVPGKFGSALEFDGSNDYINLSSHMSPFTYNDMTVMAWYKSASSSNPDDQYVFSHNTNPETDFVTFGLTDDAGQVGKMRFGFEKNSGGDQFVYSSSVVVNQQWQHIVGVRENGRVKLYVNGVLETDAADGTSGPITISGEGPFIGDWPGNTEQVFGTLDDFKFYNYARTPAQIIEDMNAGHPVGGSPLGSQVGYWKFDEGYGTTANDSSLHGNNLTFNTASWSLGGKFNKAWSGTGATWLSRADDNDFDFAATDDFSISLWFKSSSSTNPGATEWLLNKSLSDGTQQAGYAIYANTSGQICFGIDDDTTWTPDDAACSSTDVYDATWHHITARKTSTSRIDIYIDGVLSGSDTSLSATGTLANDRILYVGDREGTDNSNEFNGLIDELKIYRAALTTDQVLTEYNRGKSAMLGSTGTPGSVTASSSTGLTNPTSGTNDNSYGSIAWSNPGNILSSDNSRASATLSGTNNTNYLTATNFGLAIPDGATILGITVSVERVRSGGSSGNARDNVVRLVKSGSVVGDNKANTSTNWPTSEASASYGGSSDLWGTTWTPSELNASNFGIVFAATGSTESTNRVANVDHIQINVAYTDSQSVGSNSAAREYCIPGDANACNPPILHYTFNENTGTSTVNDISGNNRHGTMNGSMTASQWVPGKLGSALLFDGTNDYIGVPNFGAVNDYSISLWVSPNYLVNSSTVGDDTTGCYPLCTGADVWLSGTAPVVWKWIYPISLF